MAALVHSSRDFLLGDASVPPERLQSVDLAAVLREAEELFRPRLAAKGLELRVSCGEGLRARALPEVLRESVLGNLLSNAIKFSRQGGLIEVAAAREAGRVLLSVEDSGPGLPAEVLAALADEGEVPSRPGTWGEPGKGYGLRLVREHLGRMGGGLELGPGRAGGLCARVSLQEAT